MPKKKRHQPKTINEDEEIESLNALIQAKSPNRGFAPPLHQQMSFWALPLSDATPTGLEYATQPFSTITAIQNACIPHAVAVRDIMGAALTGSGKTFAFVNPMLECLYRNQMRPSDDPGAVVLSPTRGLAV
jgi:ATP-dependent RNA helicase DDX10/DBP4